MNKEAVKKQADEILFFEYIQKQAGLIDISKNKKEIGKLFTNYILNKTFTDVKTKSKVPYYSLDPKSKEKVWNEFWNTIANDQKLIEKEVNEVIKGLTTKPVI